MKNQRLLNFCTQIGINLNQFNGKEIIGGGLWLRGLTSIPEGFNPTVGGDLSLDGLTSIPEGFNPTVGGDLWLRGLTSIPEGFNPTVGGGLWLRGLTSIPEGFNPTVGGGLWLRGLTSIPEGFNPTVGGGLSLDGLTSIPEGFNPTVGGGLSLDGLTSIPEGFNPTVGGGLWLDGLTSIPEGFNPTVGGDLWLRGLTSIPEGFNPTVGGDLSLRGLTSIPEGFNPTVGGGVTIKNKYAPIGNKKAKNKLLVWDGGKYISADGIFTEVLSKKGTSYKVKKIHSTKEFYLVTNGGFHAHGDTLKRAKEDFRFKIMSEKLKSSPINKDTIISIAHFRLITGACEFGTKEWLQQNNIKADSMKASELLPILEKTNAYGLDKFKKLITF
jgi:hypothetical protein